MKVVGILLLLLIVGGAVYLYLPRASSPSADVAATLAILNTDINLLIHYSRRAEISAKVKDALAGVIAKRNEMVAVDRQIQLKTQKMNEIISGQARIRENAKVYEGPNKQRELDRLAKAEDEITKLQGEIGTLQTQRAEKQQEFEKSLESLNVE